MLSLRGNTTYSVVASIGKCFTTGSVNIKTVPYPLSNAGTDTFICYDGYGQIDGNSERDPLLSGCHQPI